MLKKPSGLASAQRNIQPANLNYIHQGIIHNIYIGDQSAKKFQQTFLELQRLSAGLRDEGKAVLVIADLTKLGQVGLHTRQLGIGSMRQMDVDKVAMFGGNSATRTMVSIMLKVSGMSFKMKFFETEAEAIEWLKDSYR